VSYILEAAAVVKDKEETKKGDVSKLAGDISIVYCIDISGSMSGHRLDSVKKTISAQLKEMKEVYPDRKVGLVTFSDNVKVIGDGTKDIVSVDAKFNNDYEFLMKNGKTIASTSFDKPIK
jgi:Mg-chelatase subunit ChlD